MASQLNLTHCGFALDDWFVAVSLLCFSTQCLTELTIQEGLIIIEAVHISEEYVNAIVVVPWSIVGGNLFIGKIILSCLDQFRDHLWSTRI